MQRDNWFPATGPWGNPLGGRINPDGSITRPHDGAPWIPSEEDLIHTANILDAVHATLDSRLWDKVDTSHPTLRKNLNQWVHSTVLNTLESAGYTQPHEWLNLVVTGSLTTFQYSEKSDLDISLFVDHERFPDWSRAEVIGIMMSQVDGTLVPGTKYPLQCYVVPPDVSMQELYKPGLRSGYDLETDHWIVPPERDRVHDIQAEMNGAYLYALEQVDKMELLLKYNPEAAQVLWDQIHHRRRQDMKDGRGDYTESNIVFKLILDKVPEVNNLVS